MTPKSLRILAAGLALPLLLPADAAVRINEVADKGTPGTCGGADWIELSLPATASAPVDLTAGYVLHDDNGAGDDDALAFAALAGTLAPLEPGDYLLLCRGDDFAFGIGGDDTVTLVDAAGAVASTTGALPGQRDEGVAYAFDEAAGAYAYTTTPTPGQANVVTPPESVDEMRARLVAQDAEGRAFFNMGPDGRQVEGGFAEVVDLNIQMDPDVRRDMHERGESHGTWREWENATITGRDGAVLRELPSPGRIRPKGQSTLYTGACMDRAVPYSLDFGRGAAGSDPDQTLFGVERAYLRTHYGDGSYAREWAAHRMLARFGLAHLRTRTVRLFINGKYEGLYDLTEAPDQDYVHQRSFPGFDPEGTGLYKVKSMAIWCGNYDTVGMLIFGVDMMEAAQARVDEPGTPPYHFERGEHLPIIEVQKDLDACGGAFIFEGLRRDMEDAALAFVRSGEECGEFLVDAGLVDRDLGRKDTEGAMAAFVNAHLGPSSCEPGCANSDLADDVDLTNYLRNAAAYTAMLNQDSPMGNGNNYYLALNGGRWSIVQWDHNNIMSGTAGVLCDPNAVVCPLESLVDWDIRRPTCRSYEQNQMFGPLLSDPALRARYLGYLGEFVDDVMTDEEFLGQIQAHLEAIQGDVADDSWSDDVRLFPKELSASDDEEWFHEGYYTTLLGTMRARASSIAAQLEAIDAGTSPRALADIGPDEPCVDWRLDGPREFPQGCPDNCQYEGCAMPGAAVPGFCDPESQTCVHGVSDDKCEGIPNLQGYEGIEPFEGSDQPPFCFTDGSVGLGPTKMAQCPPKEEEKCPDDCQYEGCYREGFTVPGLCDPDSGCVHGIRDAKCEGVPNLQGYEGIESFEGSDKPAICVTDPTSGVVLKMAQCPPKEEEGVDCPNNCQYEGCYREGFIVPGLCDPDSGCVHGTLDEKCVGVPDLQQYEGMENFEGSDQMAMCFKDPTSGVALKVAQCPAMKDPEPAPTPEDPAPTASPTASPTGVSAPSPDEGATGGGGKVGGGGTSSGPGIAASTLFAFRVCAGVVLVVLLAI